MTYHKINTVTLLQAELLYSHKKMQPYCTGEVCKDSRTVQPNREFGLISAKFKVGLVLTHYKHVQSTSSYLGLYD